MLGLGVAMGLGVRVRVRFRIEPRVRARIKPRASCLLDKQCTSRGTFLSHLSSGFQELKLLCSASEAYSPRASGHGAGDFLLIVWQQLSLLTNVRDIQSLYIIVYCAITTKH